MALLLTLFLVTFPIFSNGALISHKKVPNVFKKHPSNVQYCGVRSYDNSLIGRVVGGRNAEPGEVPFYASVEEYKLFQLFNYKKCGGVLISNRWILTAAHCTFGWFGTLSVVLGEKTNNRTIAVENFYRHPNFNLQTLANDIALLLLAEPVQYNEDIQPICLPEPGEDEKFYGLHGTVAGWGKLDPKSKKLPSKMQIITVPIIRYDDCQKSYSKAGHNKTTIIDSVVCAGYQEGGKDACFGDSGGPLMVNTQGHWVLAGIVSNGISCAKPNLPGIYTRVSYFLDWIKKTIYEEALKKDKLL